MIDEYSEVKYEKEDLDENSINDGNSEMVKEESIT
jgi:hypothetical protein